MKKFFINLIPKFTDWRDAVRYAKIYAITCGIGLNIYWIYEILTNT
jgi:hypothetical protein